MNRDIAYELKASVVGAEELLAAVWVKRVDIEEFGGNGEAVGEERPLMLSVMPTDPQSCSVKFVVSAFRKHHV